MLTLENILSAQMIQKIGWMLMHFTWQATAVAMVLAVLLRILRRFSANLRYIVACMALLLIVLLPVLTIGLIDVSPSYTPIHTEPMTEPMTELLTEPVAEAYEAAPVAPAPSPAEAETFTNTFPEPVYRKTGPNYKQTIVAFLEPKLGIIVMLWLLGVFALSIWNLGGLAQLHRLKRRMVRPVDESLCSRLRELAGILGIHRVVEIMESALIGTPTVVGWLKPVILLPAGVLTGLTTEQLEGILAHELAHIRRYDYLINILQTVVETLGFYHPAVWWISRKIRIERENCCDDIAVKLTGDSIGYAKTLASFEEIQAGRPELAIATTGGYLFSRISRLLGKDSSKKYTLSLIPTATGIMILTVLVAMISSHIAYSQDNLRNSPNEQNEAADTNDVKERLIDAGLETNEVAFYSQFTDPRDYVRLGGERTAAIPYDITRLLMTKDKLPILYELLEDDDYAPYWHKAALVIGYISDDPDSVDVILNYFQRDDISKLNEDGFYGKIESLSYIGMIGGETADSVLKQAVTRDGAAELVKAWINEDYLQLTSSGSIIDNIQEAAMKGIVYTGNQENIEIIENLYNQQKILPVENNVELLFIDVLERVMSMKSYIADNGLETYYRLNEEQTRALRPYLDKYRMESSEARMRAQYSGPREYVKLGMIFYNLTRELVTKDDLEILYELLDDDDYAPHWYNVVSTIGYVSDDPDSVNVLLDFIKRNDISKLDVYNLGCKTRTLTMMGLIGGDTADSVLRKAVTKEGAEELTQDWINEEPWPEAIYFSREQIIRFIQIDSLTGLVYTGKQENLDFVEQLYNREKEISIENNEETDMMSPLIDAMAEKDLIAEIGFESFMALGINAQLSALIPYLRKYSFDLENPEPISRSEETSPNTSVIASIDDTDGEIYLESTENASNAQYADPREYVKTGSIRYGAVRENISKDQLPILYELFDDDDYAPYWDNVSEVIGFISDDTNSIPVLLNYFQRDDGSKNFSMGGKIGSLSWIGKIGGDQADSILKNAITEEGAEELAKEWIDDGLWQDRFYINEGKDRIILLIQAAAIKGLVYSGKQENLDIVENLYNEQFKISKEKQERTDLMGQITDAMAYKDYIADKGMEDFLNNAWRTDNGTILSPYFQKYFLLWEEEITEEVLFSDPRQYVKLGTRPYDEVREVISKDQLPLLYELLEDDDYAPYWHTVARNIGYISDDPDSVDVLLNYFQRNDRTYGYQYTALLGKIWTLAIIGKIGGETADSTLKEAVTRDGAEELAKAWIRLLNTEQLLNNIQENAMIGLVLSGKQENLDFLENLYNEQKALSIQNQQPTSIMVKLTIAMATKDFIADNSLEYYLDLSRGAAGQAITPYFYKYTWDASGD